MTDEFGHWLAGFADGEGCFSILRQTQERTSYLCIFALVLRADDYQILQEIHRVTGIGTLTYHRPYASAQPNAKPQARWRAASRADCAKVVELFERYPLRSKKARDFEIWKRAVNLWLTRKRSDGTFGPDFFDDMAALKAELQRTREYEVMGEDVSVLLPTEHNLAAQETLWEEAA